MRSRATRLRATGGNGRPVFFAVDYLVAAGGGGGGTSKPGFATGGGGGGGGVATGALSVLRGSSVSITVGAGGGQRVQGGNSTLGSIIAGGGGFGGLYSDTVALRDRGSSGTGGTGIAAGGGGGGAAFDVVNGSAGGSGTQRTGGNGATTSINGIGGSGGGAGGNASSSGGVSTVGVGITSSITGASVAYGTGGASDGYSQLLVANTGRGGNPNGYGNPQASAGVIVVSYPDSLPDLTISAGLTFDRPTVSGRKVYRFTGGTGIITF